MISYSLNHLTPNVCVCVCVCVFVCVCVCCVCVTSRTETTGRGQSLNEHLVDQHVAGNNNYFLGEKRNFLFAVVKSPYIFHISPIKTLLKDMETSMNSWN